MISKYRRRDTLACKAALGVLFACLVSVAYHLQASGLLAPVDVQAALDVGRSGDPQPLVLRPVARADSAVVTGLVYTPFTRVAMFAKTRQMQGGDLTPEQVDPQLLEPVVYVAFRWWGPFGSTSAKVVDDSVTPTVYAIPDAARSNLGGLGAHHERIKPVWVSKGTSALRRFGVSPPYDDIALVAAFPVETFQADHAFVILKAYSEGVVGSESVRATLGTIREADLARLR